jgi:hypothetical protein
LTTGGRRTGVSFAEILKRLGLLDVSNCMILPASGVNPDLPALAPPFEARFLVPDEIEAFSRDPQNRLPRRFLDEALRKGDDCHAVLDGDRLASFAWYSREATKALGGFIHFPTDYIYAYHGFTLPRYRGRKLRGIGSAQALAFYAGTGCAGFVAIVGTTNQSSQASSRRMGYREVGRFFKFGPGRYSRVLASGGCIDHGIRITPRRKLHGG